MSFYKIPPNKTMNSKDYKTEMSSLASYLIHRLHPLTALEAQEFKRQHRICADKYGFDHDWDIHIENYIELCKAFRNCFHKYLTKLSDLIKTNPFVGFEVFNTKHNIINEEILKEFITITKDFDNNNENTRNRFHFGYNFKELLKNLIEVIYNGFEELIEDIEEYEKENNYQNESELTEEIIDYQKIFEEFWKNISTFVNKYGFYGKDYTEYMKRTFDEKYAKFLNNGLNIGFNTNYGLSRLNVNQRNNSLYSQRITKLEKELENLKIKYENGFESKQKVINKNFKEKEVSDEENGWVVENMVSDKELVEMIENYNSIKTKINELFESREEVNELNKKFEEQQVVIDGLRKGMDEKGVEVMSGRKEFENKVIKIELKEIKESFGSLQSKTDVMMSQILDLFEEMTKLKQKLSENKVN